MNLVGGNFMTERTINCSQFYLTVSNGGLIFTIPFAKEEVKFTGQLYFFGSDDFGKELQPNVSDHTRGIIAQIVELIDILFSVGFENFPRNKKLVASLDEEMENLLIEFPTNRNLTENQIDQIITFISL